MIRGLSVRKYYIDNLRTFCILLLIPFHTAMIYNNWGEVFYVNATKEYVPSLFVTIVYPWWMTLLFTMAGMSSYYALQMKSTKQYLSERVHKLLIPLCVALVVLIPPQTYIADVFHNGYSETLWQHYSIYYTRITDLTGADGGFTPGHLWFVLYLFCISVIMTPFMNKYMHAKKKWPVEKISVIGLILLFAIVLICTPILEIGKSVGESIACFAIGFFVLSNEAVQTKIMRYCWLFGGLFFSSMMVRIWRFQTDRLSGLLCEVEYRFYLWMGILFLLGFAYKHWNRTTPMLTSMAKGSFALYYFHQTVLVIIAYFVVRNVSNICMQIVIIIGLTFLTCIVLYEISRRFRITSFLFGIKYEDHKCLCKNK